MGEPHDAQAAPRPRGTPGAAVVGLLVFLAGETILLANAGITMPDILPEPNGACAADVDFLFRVILALVGFFLLLTEGPWIDLLRHFRPGTTRDPRRDWTRPRDPGILFPHTAPAVVDVPLVLVTVARAARRRFDDHRWIARWTLPVRLHGSVTGGVIFFMLCRLMLCRL